MAGITNLLLDGATAAIAGNGELIHQSAARIRSQHWAVAETLLADLARQSQIKQEINHLVSEFTNLCQAITVLGEATPRALDAVASLGERLCVRLLAAVLEAGGIASQWVEATQLIITDRQFQAAHPDLQLTERATRQVLEPLLAQSPAAAGGRARRAGRSG